MELTSTPVPVPDGSAAVRRIAVLLARNGTAGLPAALAALVQGAALRSAVLRSCGPGRAGELVAVGGDVVHAVPASGTRSAASVIELPVRGPGAALLGTLTVVGAQPAALPALRAAAAVVALTLAGCPLERPEQRLEELLEDAEAERDALADRLHDGAVQDLVAARYAADAALTGADLAVARHAVQAALVALRRTLWHLRPRGGNGLAEALRGLSERQYEAGLRPLLLHLPPGGGTFRGPAAELAYRLVQALALATGPDAPVTVVLRRGSAPGALSVQVTGAGPLPGIERWGRRARALGGELTAAPGRICLVLPGTGAPLTPAAPLPGGRPSTAKATP